MMMMFDVQYWRYSCELTLRVTFVSCKHIMSAAKVSYSCFNGTLDARMPFIFHVRIFIFVTKLLIALSREALGSNNLFLTPCQPRSFDVYGALRHTPKLSSGVSASRVPVPIVAARYCSGDTYENKNQRTSFSLNERAGRSHQIYKFL